MIGCFVRKILAQFLVLATLGLTVFLGLGIFVTPDAAAAIRQIEEAPGQMVYQSRQRILYAKDHGLNDVEQPSRLFGVRQDA